jgi:putative ABC transport system permease protein
MFLYYIRLGLRSLRRNPVLTILMMLSIGFGVAASITSYAVLRVTSTNPIPEKSNQLFAVQIDNSGPKSNFRGEPADSLSYIDAMALIDAGKAQRQTALYPVEISVIPDDPAAIPFSARTYAVYNGAFKMFDIPFIYGHGWSTSEDQDQAPVAVISRSINDRLFMGENSVGRAIHLDGRSYAIVGVMDTWDPQPLYIDPANFSSFGNPIELFIPFTHAINVRLPSGGDVNCVKDPGNGWEAWLSSECTWVSYFAELPNDAAARRYREFLGNYAADQQRTGRFDWPANVRMRNVEEWLAYHHVVPPEAKLSLMVSLGILVSCIVNTAGLLLAKFIRRSPEIGIRRALGASRGSVYMQFLIEAMTVGLGGGIFGLLLIIGILHFVVGLVFDPAIAQLVHASGAIVAGTLLAAILATVLSALYPVWQAARVEPTLHLKLG